MSVYTDNGYESRKDYLKTLAEENGVPYSAVLSLASMLGPDEDFDGLVTGIEDYADEMAELDESDEEE